MHRAIGPRLGIQVGEQYRSAYSLLTFRGHMAGEKVIEREIRRRRRRDAQMKTRAMAVPHSQDITTSVP